MSDGFGVAEASFRGGGQENDHEHPNPENHAYVSPTSHSHSHQSLQFQYRLFCFGVKVGGERFEKSSRLDFSTY